MRLLALAARRCLWMPPTLLGLTLIVFSISHIIPSDPARVLAGENAPIEQVEALRRKFGLDLPLPQQFFRYVTDVVSGNMGISLYTQRPVADDLLERLPATFELAIYAMILAVLLGLPLGVVSALRRNSLLDHAVRVVTISGLAMAAFWLAILLQLLFSMKLNLTPVQGRIDGWGPDPITGFYTLDAVLRGDWEMLGSSLRYLALPVMPLAIPAMATIVRFTRAGVLNVMSSNFVFYQNAMGLPRRVVIWKYILRSALIGTLTQIGLVFGNLLAGAVVVEAVFSWPGLGTYAYNSILQSDYNAIMGFTLFTGTVFICVNLLVDIAQAVLDPRGR
ncbi:ABC transporter permease [Limobrevibacterium gyesilva]|uniref:ABC transporter permease n=1 Tax=Limobrevibacterium gyesilva TaxID=2991712 RepID=A0AA42CDL9_9PROT|nr:ABC transporter permease [Limobrevibacterium gyesilva]MCW3474064.1 ABC transporter permease [Limobrevibacterium gyesilva]